LYTSNLLPTVFVLTILRTFCLLGQRESLFEKNATPIVTQTNRDQEATLLATGGGALDTKPVSDGESHKDIVSLNSMVEINDELDEILINENF
jgi:hypothetical protein